MPTMNPVNMNTFMLIFSILCLYFKKIIRPYLWCFLINTKKTGLHALFSFGVVYNIKALLKKYS